MLNVKLNNREGTNGVEPNILRAARNNDFKEAADALKVDSACITETNHLKQNALQISILEFHNEMSIFLLDQSKVSAFLKNVHDIDALQLAIHIGDDALVEKVYGRWNEEYLELLSKNNVTKFDINPK